MKIRIISAVIQARKPRIPSFTYILSHSPGNPQPLPYGPGNRHTKPRGQLHPNMEKHTDPGYLMK